MKKKFQIQSVILRLQVLDILFDNMYLLYWVYTMRRMWHSYIALAPFIYLMCGIWLW